MTEQERTALFSQDHVKSWLNEIRSAIRERRALQNVGLTIPEEFIGFLRENIENYSKLMKYVNVKKLGGDGRIVIMGGVPEAIWTECCANINELELQFNDDEFGCWKIAGFYPVCNANLEDSDLDLANEILTALSQGLGLGVDKAIVYGTGIRMPQGIVTRLVQTSKPAGYSTTAREWVDLHTSNVKVINSASMTPAELFKEIVLASGAAKSNYARNGLVWVMNETTKTRLMADTISVDANGKIVTGVADTMPVLGGAIETLNFMPDYVIVGGYFECYTLAERAGKKFATSEHVRFLADQTVFKGTARYDGHPVIAEAFVVLSLLNTAISADAVSFDPDVANTGQGIILEKTVMTVKATKTAKVNAITVPAGQPLTFTSSDTSKATVAADGTVTGVAAGNATIIVASGNAVAAVALTVTAA